LGRYRDHHPAVGAADFLGQEVIGDLLVHFIFPMHSPQRPFHRRQHVVARGRHAKGKQGGGRITQGVGLTAQMDRQFLKRSVQRRRYGSATVWASASSAGRLVKMWTSVSPSRVGWSNCTVIRRPTSCSPVSGSVSTTPCSKTRPVALRPTKRCRPQRRHTRW